MPRTTIGIVGYGKIAEDQHAPAIRANPDFELVAAVSRGGPPPTGVPHVFASQTEMLAALPDLGAVAICTPPGPRPGLVREALAANRHVLLEKPTAATIGEAEDLQRLAAASSRSVFATWHSRFNPAVDQARDVIAAEGVRRLVITWKEDVRHWHPGQEWIWQPGGFGVFDPGSNALSILTRILPEPLFVKSAELEFPSNRDTPIAANLAFATVAGNVDLSAVFDWRQTGPQHWDVAVDTLRGTSLLLSNGGATLTRDGRGAPEEAHREYGRIYERFAELIRDGRSDFDVSPLRLIADAFLVGRRIETDPFV